MENLIDYGYRRMDNGIKVCHFLQGIKITELEAAVNVVWTQPKKYGTDFNVTMYYLGQMVMKECASMQYVHIAKTESQWVKPKVAAFMGKIESNKYPKAVWNSMTKEQQMQVRKLYEQQDMKLATKQTIEEARIAALQAKLGISCQPKEDDVKKKERETPKEQA